MDDYASRSSRGKEIEMKRMIELHEKGIVARSTQIVSSPENDWMLKDVIYHLLARMEHRRERYTDDDVRDERANQVLIAVNERRPQLWLELYEAVSKAAIRGNKETAQEIEARIIEVSTVVQDNLPIQKRDEDNNLLDINENSNNTESHVRNALLMFGGWGCDWREGCIHHHVNKCELVEQIKSELQIARHARESSAAQLNIVDNYVDHLLHDVLMQSLNRHHIARIQEGEKEVLSAALWRERAGQPQPQLSDHERGSSEEGRGEGGRATSRCDHRPGRPSANRYSKDRQRK